MNVNSRPSRPVGASAVNVNRRPSRPVGASAVNVRLVPRAMLGICVKNIKSRYQVLRYAVAVGHADGCYRFRSTMPLARYAIHSRLYTSAVPRRGRRRRRVHTGTYHSPFARQSASCPWRDHQCHLLYSLVAIDF